MPYASFSVPCIRDRAKVLAHKACGARAFGRDGLLLNAFGLPYVNSIANYKIKDTRVGEVAYYVADISKAKKLLNYNPETSLKEGIKKTIEWWKERGEL